MRINIKGYKNIENLDYEIEKNKVNVLIGISGSGKSSIAGALLEEDVERNKKIDYIGEVVSSIDGVIDPIINAFDDKILNKYLFDKDKNDNMYNVLIDDEEKYKEARIHLENRLVEINKILDLENSKYLELKELVKELVGTLTTKNELRTSSAIIKAKNSLTKIGRSNVYTYLNSLDPKHADWFVKGVDYIDDIKKECPFCTKKLNVKQQNIIDRITDVDLKSKIKVNDSIDSFDKYLTSDIAFNLKGIEKLEKEILTISIALKEFDKLRTDVSNLYDMDLNLDKINFDYNKDLFKIFQSLEEPVKLLKRRRIALKNNFTKAQENTKKIFGHRLSSINNVIESLGIPYTLEAKYKRGSIFGYKLYHNDDKKQEERIDSLSTGERKIISLIFFVLEQQYRDCDLVIFDDPVSSFDDNRRYSLYRYVTQTLKGKTMLILSHDQLFARFAVEDRRKFIGNVSYFENLGNINVVNIEKKDFDNISYYIKERIRLSSTYMQRIINLRYYYELNRKVNVYKYITKIIKKENVSEWLINSNILEKDLIDVIYEDIGITLELFDESFYSNVNIEDLSIMEKVFILRNMEPSGMLKLELSNFIHLSSKFAISLNPYKFSFASNYVIKAIDDNLDSIHNF